MFSEQTVLDWIVKGFVAVLGWLGVNLHKRISDLENRKAAKEDLNAAVSDLKNTMKEHRDETRQGFSEIRTILLKDVRHND